jgi:hypothetical protein
MTLDRSYIGYLGFLGIDLFKSVLMHSNGTICLIKLLFKMGLFTVHVPRTSHLIHHTSYPIHCQTNESLVQSPSPAELPW